MIALQDVGAMRFPGMKYMDRVIGRANNSLVNFINANVQGRDIVQKIPYIFKADNTFRLYNDILSLNQQAPSNDLFRVNVSDGGTVPDAFAVLNPYTVWKDVLKQFTDALSISFDAGFNKLMEMDSLSVREYFRSLGYTDAEVDWLETTNDATGHYDSALSQMVLEQWVFAEAPLSSWVTVEGGLSRIVNGMLKTIRGPVHYSQRVTSISRTSDAVLNVTTDSSSYQYSHVIATVPLGALQAIDMDSLNLEYGKKLAIRKLNYDPAGKIGMKFRSRWWENLPLPFKGGQSYSDLPIRRCVYPSYGVNTTDAAGTMIASYVSLSSVRLVRSYSRCSRAGDKIRPG